MRATAITPLDYANVRSKPNDKSPIVGSVYNGQTVTVTTETDNGWTRLESPTGWVYPKVQFVKLLEPQPGDYVSDGLESPVGSAAGRANGVIYPDGWTDANPYGTLNYLVGKDGRYVLRSDGSKVPNSYHTGSDLNWNTPTEWNADADEPLYAISNGVLTTVRTYPVWGWIIILKCDPLPDGTIAYARYAHMATVRGVEGQRVKRGDVVGTVGNAFGRYTHHLHFDVSLTEILATHPEHWPKLNRTELNRHYVNPREFLERHHWGRYGG